MGVLGICYLYYTQQRSFTHLSRNFSAATQQPICVVWCRRPQLRADYTARLYSHIYIMTVVILNIGCFAQQRFSYMGKMIKWLMRPTVMYGNLPLNTRTHQWCWLGFDPFIHLTTLEGAEIKPGKHSYTRIKPLLLTNSHGRYITVTVHPNGPFCPLGNGRYMSVT